MPGDPYYSSKAWRELRRRVLERDGYRCCVPGCPFEATLVDHIVSRRRGGPDAPHNLRSLCAAHDRAIKEKPNGERAQDGRLFLKGAYADGMPCDVEHPWNRQ